MIRGGVEEIFKHWLAVLMKNIAVAARRKINR